MNQKSASSELMGENRVTEYEVAGLSGNWDDAYGEENVVAVCLTN